MGYFATGTEGADWYDRNCRRCANSVDVNGSPGCPIWDLHLLHNYDQQPEGAKTSYDKGHATAMGKVLGALIVQGADLSNTCKLFREVTDE